MTMRMYGPVPTDQIRELATPELALALLQTLVKGGATINANSSFRGAEQAWNYNNEPDVAFLLNRLSDAWAWLESHGMIGPAASNTTSAWQQVTTIGRELAADPGELADAGDRQVALAMHRLHAAQRCPANGRAVIAVAARDDVLLLRPAFKVPIVAHEPDDGVV